MPESFEDLESAVGTRVTTVEGLAVEAGKVEEFARAVRDPNPAHRDPEVAERLGFPAVPAPMTFTRTSYFPRYRPDGVGTDFGMDLGLHWDRLVHGEQAYALERPAYVGDVLSGETTLADAYQRESSGGGTLTFVVYETEYRDADGDLVLTEELTRIETPASDDAEGGGDGEGVDADCPDAGTEPGADRDEPGRSDGAVGSSPWADGEVEPAALADLSVGTASPEYVVEGLDRRDFVRYAGASGDFSRLHYDGPYVRSLGYESVFAQGMLTMGVAAGLVASWFGLGRVASFRGQFRDQVWPGESVTVAGEVTEITANGDTTEVEATIEVTTDDERTVFAGDATATDARDDS